MAEQKKKKRKPNPAFMKPMQPDAQLSAVVGDRPMPRTEVTKKIWDYIKKNNLQDSKNKRMINADEKLKSVFNGKRQALLQTFVVPEDAPRLVVERAQVAGEEMLRGLDLVYKQFLDTLGRFGLKAIEAKGQPFDPNFHQAISTVPSDEVAENTVVEEFRRGYTLNGKLLRAAMVSVSAGK